MDIHTTAQACRLGWDDWHRGLDRRPPTIITLQSQRIVIGWFNGYDRAHKRYCALSSCDNVAHKTEEE